MQQEFLHIDATPDESYPLRILQAYRRLGDYKWSNSSNDVSENSILVKTMNELQAKRNVLLDRAIAILATQQTVALDASPKDDADFDIDARRTAAAMRTVVEAAKHAEKFLEDHATDSRQSWMRNEAKRLRTALDSQSAQPAHYDLPETPSNSDGHSPECTCEHCIQTHPERDSCVCAHGVPWDDECEDCDAEQLEGCSGLQ